MFQMKFNKEDLPNLIGLRDKHLLNISAYQFKQLLETDGVPTLKIGNKTYIIRDKFIEWLDEHLIKTIQCLRS